MGWINPNRPLGGEVVLHPEPAGKAVSRIAVALGVKDEYEMAEAIVKLGITKMVGGIKIVSTGRGHDVRDFILMIFGGAGPMFGTQIASELGISKVVIPLGPGNFCAIGMLQCEVVHQHLKPVRIMTSDIRMEDLRSMFAELKENGEKQLLQEGFSRANMRFEERVAMRYSGQHFTLELPLTASISDLQDEFYKAHQEVYQFAFDEPVMITELIINACGTKPKALLEKPKSKVTDAADALSERRAVRFEGRFVDTPVYRRDDVPVGSHLQGPVIFEELGATTVVQPGWTATVDDMGNLILEMKV
jgi:N-methylhydantoinase A